MTVRSVAASVSALLGIAGTVAGLLSRTSGMVLLAVAAITAILGFFGVLGVAVWRALPSGLAPVIDARRRARSAERRWNVIDRADPDIAVAHMADWPGPGLDAGLATAALDTPLDPRAAPSASAPIRRGPAPAVMAGAASRGNARPPGHRRQPRRPPLQRADDR